MSEVLYFPQAASNHPPKELGWAAVARAKRLMRAGVSLHEAAEIIGVRSRDLDVALWKSMTQEAWG